MHPIIVAVDESPESGTALRLAHLLAARTSRSIVAIEVARPTSAEHSPGDLARFEESIARRARRWLPDDLAPEVAVEVSDGPVSSVLVNRARALDASFVLLGAHESEGHTRLGLGSAAHSLAHDLTCPLIVVPDIGSAELTGNVVVGIDGSDASAVALEAGAALAAQLGGSAVAVYAIDDIYTTFSSHGWYGKEEVAARQEALAGPAGVEFVERLGGSTEDILTDLVHERHASVLVVAARERHGLGGLLLGDVPDHLMHRPPCPVMVLPYAFVTTHEPAAHG
ncbi:MAG: universal stress protein [Acidimicrobiales bacterium]|nr:universal stress protein [Acidimicrobiales bacterium]